MKQCHQRSVSHTAQFRVVSEGSLHRERNAKRENRKSISGCGLLPCEGCSGGGGTLPVTGEAASRWAQLCTPFRGLLDLHCTALPITHYSSPLHRMWVPMSSKCVSRSQDTFRYSKMHEKINKSQKPILEKSWSGNAFYGVDAFSLRIIQYDCCAPQFLILMATWRVLSLVSGLKLEVEKGSCKPVNTQLAVVPVFNGGTQGTQGPYRGQNPFPI